MNLTHKQEKLLYQWCIDNNIDLQYGKLSLCDLFHFRHSSVRDNRRYQVHCEDRSCEWSKIYDEIGPAIEKFMEIKKRIHKTQ